VIENFKDKNNGSTGSPWRLAKLAAKIGFPSLLVASNAIHFAEIRNSPPSSPLSA